MPVSAERADEMTKLSVIIDARNVRKDVKTAVESLRNRTLKEIEILCTGDGFADDAGRTLKECVLASSGEYVLFVSGDSPCAPETCAAALRAVECADGEPISAVFPEQEVTDTLWNKICRGDTVRRAAACFPEEGLRAAEDLLAVYLALTAEGCPVDEVLGELASRLCGCGEELRAQMAAALSELELFRVKKKQIRTVGTFNYRLKLGGIEKVLSNLAYIWKDMGYDVVVFTDEEPSPEDYPLPEGIRRVVLPTAADNTREAWQRRARAFREELERCGVDVMVYHGWLSPGVVADEMCIKSAGVPLVIHTHGMFAANYSVSRPNLVQRDLLLSRSFRLSECVVTLTEVDQAWWSAMGNRACRTVNPLSRSVKESPVASLNGHTVLWVGRLSPEKQPEDALRIIELVRRQVPDARLQFVGKGEDGSGFEEALKERVKELGLEDAVSFEGFQADVEPYYLQASALLSTSQFEGFGMVFMESKVCGLPLVAYELPNLDIMRHPRGLYAVPQRDHAKAAQRLAELLTDEALRRWMGQEARADAEEFYGTDIRRYWQEIFRLALTPASAGTPLVERPALEAAAAIAVGRLSQGLGSQWAEVQELERQIVAYHNSLEEMRNSTAYRLGSAITLLPRKLKMFLHRVK